MTKKQRKLLEFIKTFKKVNKIEPTQIQCAVFLGVSQPAISKMLKKLK